MLNKSLLSVIIILSVLLLMAGSAMAGKRAIDKIEFPPLNDITLPEIDKETLSNGVVVYILEDHEFPVVNARIRLAVGDYLEPADKIGLAAICGEVMRTGGTANMTGDEIDEALESIGASVEVGIGTTSGNASMNILSEYVDTGLEILADVLSTPQFAEDKIEISKNAQRTSISSRNDDALSICIREFRKIIFDGASPYARHTEYATINSITQNDLKAFHKKWVTPENMMIAIWGDFEKVDMLAKLEQYFGALPAGGQKVPALPEVDYQFVPSVNYIEKDNITQSSILVGHIGGLTGDPDYFALTVANNVLSGGFGGRMFNEVRSKKGLAYSTGGMYSTNISHPGIFYNYVITKLESTAEAIDAVMHEIRRMQSDPPTPDELQKAKDAYLNSFVFKFDSKGEIINRMMDYDYYNFPQDFLYTAKKEIEKVTAEDVVDVCQRRFHPDEMHLVVVGIADQFDRPLSEFGQVATIDVTIPSGEVEEEIEITEATLARGLEIVKKSAKACGGIDKFAQIKGTRATLNMTIFTPQMNLEFSGEKLTEYPFNSREVMSNPMVGEIISVKTENEGWIKQMGQVKTMGSEDLADSHKEAFRDINRLFSDADNPDYQAVYIGSDEINGTPVEMVKLISADGEKSFKTAFDSETFLPVAKMYFGNTMTGPANLVQHMSDYKSVAGGYMIPFSIDVENDKGDKMIHISIEDYTINPEMAADSFTKPE